MLLLVFYCYEQGFIVVAKSFMYPYFLKIHFEKQNCWIKGYAPKKQFLIHFANFPSRAVHTTLDSHHILPLKKKIHKYDFMGIGV